MHRGLTGTLRRLPPDEAFGRDDAEPAVPWDECARLLFTMKKIKNKMNATWTVLPTVSPVAAGLRPRFRAQL